MAIIIKIKEGIKSNQNVERGVRKLLRPYFWLRMQKENCIVWLHRKGLVSTFKYNYLKGLKNTHKGERCFIVATGPSLTIEDLDLLSESNNFCFSMNSCALILDKTKWIPDMLGIQDEFVYNKVIDKLKVETEGKLSGKVIVSNTISNLFSSARDYHQFYLHYLDHKYDRQRTGVIKFSDECENVVFDGYSIIFSLMQIAVYMGFKEIYLLGCDCNYKQEKQHFVETGHIDPYALNVGERLIYVHSKFKEFADKHNVIVVNCTRGGMLEVYPRMNLEDVLRIEQKKEK